MIPALLVLAALTQEPAAAPASQPPAAASAAPSPEGQAPPTQPGAAPAKTPSRNAAPPVSQETHPGMPGLDIVWWDTFEDAVAEAKKFREPRVLIEFYEPNCPACHRLEQLIVPSASFYSFAKEKPPVRIDIKTPEGMKFAERLGIRVAPTWMVVTPELLVTGAVAGPANQEGWVESFIKAEKGWVEYKKKLIHEKEGPADPQLSFDIAEETYKRRGDQIAEPRFRRLAEGKSTPPQIREMSLAYLASIELNQERVEEAAKHLDTLLAIGKDPKLRERAELRMADIEVARGKHHKAAERLEKFKKDHPNSPMVADADRLLALLKPHLATGN